jgi:hypothetical protein
MTFNPLNVKELLDVADDCIEQLERRAGEITGEDEDYLAETAKRFLALASHFSPSIHEELTRRFPHVPDEVLVAKPHHTVVDWPDAPGAHEGAPFSFSAPPPPATVYPMDMTLESCGDSDPVFQGGDPMTGPALGSVQSGEVEEAGADEEER